MQSHSVVPNRAPALMLVCCAVVVVGCAKPEERAPGAETAAGTVTPAPVTPTTPSPTISLANVAGKWKMRAMDPSGGNVVEVELTATADSNWTVTGPNRRTIREHVVAVGGDSIVTESEPYESFLRKGVQVRTRNVYRFQGGTVVGTMEGHMATASGDSVTHRRIEGTRVP